MARSFVRKAGVCAFALMLFYPVSAESPAAPEVVFSASWGEKPAQVGLILQAEQERCGPLSFAVGSQGVFLLDSVNQRIVVCSRPANEVRVLSTNVSPTAICADGSGGVWIREGDSVQRIDASGNRGARRSLAASKSHRGGPVEGYGVELLRDGDGTVRARSLSQDSQVVEPGSRLAVAGSSDLSDLDYRIKRFAGNEVRLLGMDPDGKPLVSVPIVLDEGEPGAVLFKGRDADGNLYVELEKLENGRCFLEVHGYAPDGKRVRTLSLPNDYYTTVYKKTEVGPDGSVYQLRTAPGGVQIVRYQGGASR